MTLMCKWFGHKMVLNAEVCQDQCVRKGCGFHHGLSILEVEHLLDDVDDSVRSEPRCEPAPLPPINIPY